MGYRGNNQTDPNEYSNVSIGMGASPLGQEPDPNECSKDPDRWVLQFSCCPDYTSSLGLTCSHQNCARQSPCVLWDLVLEGLVGFSLGLSDIRHSTDALLVCCVFCPFCVGDRVNRAHHSGTSSEVVACAPLDPQNPGRRTQSKKWRRAFERANTVQVNLPQTY